MRHSCILRKLAATPHSRQSEATRFPATFYSSGCFGQAYKRARLCVTTYSSIVVLSAHSFVHAVKVVINLNFPVEPLSPPEGDGSEAL